MELSPITIGLLEGFTKAAEDFIAAKFEDIYLLQSGEKQVTVGTTDIVFEKEYDSDYEIVIHRAWDGEYDVRDAIKITDKTNSGFKVETNVDCEIRWEAHRKVPQLRQWT